MKKYLLLIAGATICAATCFAFPKALYVKKGDTYTKYNFGVAENLKFSEDGKWLNITGYNEGIYLEAIDYITFTAPANSTALTPTEQKEQLVQIGDDFYRNISPIQYANMDLLCMTDEFVRTYSKYDLDPKYYDVHGDNSADPIDAMTSLFKSMGAIAKGDAAAIRTAQLNGVELYQCSDWFGEFKAVTLPDSLYWEKTGDFDGIRISFPAKDHGYDFTATLTTSEEYVDWTEVDFVGRVPKAITVAFTRGETMLATLRINTTVNNEAKTVNMRTIFSSDETSMPTSNLYVENRMAIDNDKITDRVRCLFNGTELVNANATVNGVKLTDYDNWKEDIDNTHDGYEVVDTIAGTWDWIEGNRDSMIANHFTYATGEANILQNRLFLSGKISYIGKLHEILKENAYIENAYENGVWDDVKNTLTYTCDDRSVVERQVSHLNNYSDIYFTYENRAQIQGYLTWDINEESYSYESDGYYDPEKQEWVERNHTEINIHYDTMSKLTFPDLTSFAIEDYFNGTDFSRLVDDYDSIIDTYYQLSGNTRPQDESYNY